MDYSLIQLYIVAFFLHSILQFNIVNFFCNRAKSKNTRIIIFLFAGVFFLFVNLLTFLNLKEESYIETMQLNREFTRKELKKSYRRQAKLVHPDVRGKTEGDDEEHLQDRFIYVKDVSDFLEDERNVFYYDCCNLGIGEIHADLPYDTEATSNMVVTH